MLSTARCEVFLELDRPSLMFSLPVQTHITAKMRAMLFDWISQVHTGVNAPAVLEGSPDPQDMLFRTFSHVDAYLSMRPVLMHDLQLIGVACTLAAAFAASLQVLPE